MANPLNAFPLPLVIRWFGTRLMAANDNEMPEPPPAVGARAKPLGYTITKALAGTQRLPLAA